MIDENPDINKEDEAKLKDADWIDEAHEKESVIPEEDFREAIAACRKDPQLNRLFEMAPPGAKLFIGLGFYSTYFAGKVDPRQYAQCQAEIEPALTPDDLQYLIRFERDKATKQYLCELLAQRKAEETSEAEIAAAEEEETVAEAPPPKPSKGLLHAPLKRQDRTPPPAEHAPPAERAFPQVWNKAKAASAKSSRGISIKFDIDFAGLFKLAAQVAIVLGGAFALYVALRPSAPEPEEQQQAETTPAAPAPEVKPPPTEVAARPAAPPKQAPNTEQPSGTEQTYAQADANKEDAQRRGATEPAGVALEGESRAPAETNAPATAVATSETRPRGRPRVVFTDGKKIVRRPGGLIEVPRVFSCAGAGVKPFWVYGAHPEADAAKEKKARDEWQTLVQQARQAEKEAAAGDRPAGAGANML